MTIRYCRRCVLPETKPHASFDAEGVCSACRAHERKNDALAGIDWAEREREFEALLEWAREQRAPSYDVLVPVSGGKDSITQVSRVVGRGLRVLAVNVDYGIKTEIGHRNLALVPRMGASLVTYRPEEELHSRLIRIGFTDFGDPDLLSHTLLHAYPLHVALAFGVPLVVEGENSAFEYGGDTDIASSEEMTPEWFAKFAANDGRDAAFVSREYDIPAESLRLYAYPDELPASPTRAIFMSQFFHWDSERHLEVARRYGFEALGRPSEGTYRDYVGIDEKINRIHQYLKVLKFGYGRATDHACEDIRNGRLSRQEAKALVREHDLVPLSDYYTDDFCELIGMTKEELSATIESYRNPEIWQRDERGEWTIPGHLADPVEVATES